MLTDQKEKFADAIIAGMSNKAAALHAGYGEKSASSKGSQLAKDPEIVLYIAARRQLIKAGQVPQPEIVVEVQQRGSHVKTNQRKSPGRPPITDEQRLDRFTQNREAEKEQIETVLADSPFSTPEDFLRYMMNNPMAQNKDRIAAAKALQSQENAVVKGTGKKEARKNDAAEAGKGRFGGMAPPPRMVVNNK